MKIALFGANGRTGIQIVEQASKRGHEVVAFTGDVLNYDEVAQVMPGVQSVVSVIGHVKGSDPRVQTKGIQNIMKAMEATQIKRLVSMTGVGVSDPQDMPQGSGALVTKLLELFDRNRIEDGREHAEMIRQSSLDWTIVRAQRLNNGPKTTSYRRGYIKASLFSTVSRSDVADFILTILEQGSWIKESPILSH